MLTLFRKNTTIMTHPSHTDFLPYKEGTADECHFIRTSYLYDASRHERHVNAQRLIYDFYNWGVYLINNNVAYCLKKDELANTVNFFLTYSKNNSLNSLQENNHASKLLQTYHQIPKLSNNETANPMHGLFILKVALDHLPPEKISELYQSIQESSRHQTIMPQTRINLPNGTEFYCDHVIYNILSLYLKVMTTNDYSNDDHNLYAGLHGVNLDDAKNILGVKYPKDAITNEKNTPSSALIEITPPSELFQIAMTDVINNSTSNLASQLIDGLEIYVKHRSDINPIINFFRNQGQFTETEKTTAANRLIRFLKGENIEFESHHINPLTEDNSTLKSILVDFKNKGFIYPPKIECALENKKENLPLLYALK